jgi:hypothetical protein
VHRRTVHRRRSHRTAFATPNRKSQSRDNAYRVSPLKATSVIQPVLSPQMTNPEEPVLVRKQMIAPELARSYHDPAEQPVKTLTPKGCCRASEPHRHILWHLMSRWRYHGHFRRSPVWRSWNRADLVVSKLGSRITERWAVCTMVLLILPKNQVCSGDCIL